MNLHAETTRAGQRQSAEWKARWAEHCTAMARDGAVPFADGVGGRVGERNPDKKTPEDLRGFLREMRADFGDAVWVPGALWSTVLTQKE